MGELCPAFDEKKAKTNGHICILVRGGCYIWYVVPYRCGQVEMPAVLNAYFIH